MALLKAVYEKQDEIPESFHELYSEKGGRFELTGVEGIKTDADIQRLSTSLTKERNDHKLAKEALKLWGDLKHDEVRAQLDSIEELRARAEAGSDPAKNAAAIEAAVRSKTLPMERAKTELETKLAEAMKLVGEFQSRERTRTIHDAVRSARIESKVIDTAEEDVLFLAERMFDVVEEDGKKRVVTKDEVGVTPGIDPKTWLMEMQPKRPHWWPESNGGGARGSQPGGLGISNPWKTGNLTEQMQYLRAHGEEKAMQMARSAGKKSLHDLSAASK